MPKRKKVFESGSDSDSDGDLDQELLAASKRKRKGSSASEREDSPKRSSSNSETSDDDEEWSSKAKKKGKQQPARKRAAKPQLSDSDSVEDGEVSGSESDSGSNVSDGEVLNGDDDEKKLANMTEREREEELYKRLMLKEDKERRKMIKRKLKAKEKEAAQEKKKSDDSGVSWGASASDRRSARQDAVKQKRTEPRATALQNIKNKRQEKQRKEEEKRKKASLKVEEVYSSESSSGGSDSEAGGSARSRSRSPAKSDVSSFRSRSSSSSSDSDRESDKPDHITSKEQLTKIKLSRYKLAKWCHSPHFKKWVTGCYVRIGIGVNDGRQVYRVAEVLEVLETGKVYALETTRTNKGIRIRHGLSERVYRLEFVSNGDFTDTEFYKWQESMAVAGLSLPTVGDINHKARDIQDAVEHRIEDTEIDKMIEEKNRFRKNPYNYAVYKTQLLKQKEVAVLQDNAEKLADVNQQLEELEVRATELDRRRTANISGVSYINQRNRLDNIKESEEALQREYDEAKLAAADPFTRRRCQPTLVTKTRDPMMDPMMQAELSRKLQEASRGGRPATGSQSLLPTQLLNSKTPDTKGGEEARRPGDGQDDNLYAIHDFEITIDLPIPSAANPGLPSTLERSTPAAAPRRSLNLEDYKRKKGLI